MDARANWNDDRLDHLSGQVDSLRDKVDSLRDHMDARFDSLQNAMFITLAGILAAFGSALLATQL
jgi:hypothetical protein